MLDKDLVKEITKRADIVTVVGSYLNLVKKGRIYYAVCPFHDDSNPSLQVNPEKNLFHCWVDGHCGNAISFVMQYENLEFIDAVKKVAEIIGFDDPRLHEEKYVKKVSSELEPLINCINDLSLFYEYSLSSEEGKDAINYLTDRNINNDLIKKFHIGYSLKEGNKTIKFLQSKGHSLKTIEDLGIASNKGENTSDSNQGRVIFSILNSDNQVVGFSARRIIEDSSPKYINSPETKLFIKGNVLYNFNNAKNIAKVNKYIYVLEGFMDVIALEKAGISSAIALMGTAMSKEHINMLKKLNVEVRLCLDGDIPGQEATNRILPLLLNNNIPVRIVNNLKDDKDPDEILNTLGKEELIKYLNNLLTPFDFVINFYKNTKSLDNLEDKKALVARFLPLLLATKSQIEFDDYVYKLADVTGFSSNAIRDTVKKSRTKDLNNKEKEVIINEDKSKDQFIPINKKYMQLELNEREILYHMLYDRAGAIDFYEKNIEYFYTSIYREVANYILESKVENTDLDINNLITNIEMSSSNNKEKMKSLIQGILDETYHMPYSLNLLDGCKRQIEKNKKKMYKNEQILRATEGKTEEEKARIMADILRQNN